MSQLKQIVNNTRLYIEKCLKIVNKSGELVDFKLNHAQIIVNNIIKDLEDKKKPVRIIILKARQMGLSTYTEGYIYKKVATQKFKRGLIISHEDAAAGNLFAMYKTFYENTPVVLKPMKKYSNSSELVFENPSSDESEIKRNPGLKSFVKVKTAKNTKSGRGETFHYAHLSELAFYDDPKTLLTGLMQTIPTLPNTAIIVESTANGVGGYFYDLWKSAERGENSYIPVFLPWFIDPGYTLEFDSEEEKEALIREVNHITYEKDGTPIYTYEKELLNIAKEQYDLELTYEQLLWRRKAIKNLFNGDEDQFRQEYPSYADESFLASGRPVFQAKALNQYYAKCQKGIRGYLHYDNIGKVFFEESPKGYYEIWEMPVKDKFYCIGADVAEGLAHGDYSCAIVGGDDFNISGKFHGHIDPDLFGMELIKLAKFYNDGYLGVEKNNHGHTTLRTLQREEYWNIFFMKQYDKIADKVTQSIGWHTNLKTKPLMIDKLAEFIREKYLGIKDKELIGECLTYVKDDKGLTNAQSGCYDDHVMSTAIWLQLVLEGKSDVFKPEKSDDKASNFVKKHDFDREDEEEEYKQTSLFMECSE